MSARVVKKPSTRNTKDTSLRRVNKTDSRFADYASLKSSTGIVIPEVKKILLDRQKADPVIRTRLFPSEMSLSDWCPRATYFRMTGIPDPPSKYSLSLENVFAQGNAIHTKWQDWLASTGKLWGDWRCSRCAEYVKDSLKPGDVYSGSCSGTGWVKLGTSHFTKDMTDFASEAYPHDWKYKEVTLKSVSLPMSGHADGGLVEHNVLVELKSISAGSFRFSSPKLYESHTYDISGKKIVDVDGIWKDFHAPLTSHLRQGNLYLWMAKEMNLPFERISFLYENKANNTVKEFVVPYSYELIESALDTAFNIVEALKEGSPPACPKGGCASCKAYDKKD